MASLLADVVVICLVGFAVVAGLSLMVMGAPATPPFARRAPTSSSPQLRQDSNAQFIFDRGFLFRSSVTVSGVPPSTWIARIHCSTSRRAGSSDRVASVSPSPGRFGGRSLSATAALASTAAVPSIFSMTM